MTFKETATEWIGKKKYYIKESTYALYQYEIQFYLIPAIGNLDIMEVDGKVLQEAVLKWQFADNERGNMLKKGTIQNLVILVKQIIKYAIENGYAKQVQIAVQYAPQPMKQKNRKTMDTSEQMHLIKAILSELTPQSAGILLCISSGLRIGELCALTWADVDLENQILHITKTIQRIYMKDAYPKSHVAITTPKTESSIRDVPISCKLCKLMKGLTDSNPDHYILTNSERYIEPRTFRKQYDKFLAVHGIAHINFHSLRHTFATRCIDGGANYKAVSEILGHSTINTTLNMYVHPQMSEKRKCIEMITWE